MNNYYSQFKIRSKSNPNLQVLRLGRLISQVSSDKPLPRELVVAFRIFLNPTLKKYYDHWLHNPKRFERLGILLMKKQTEFINELENGDFPREFFSASRFWKLAWSDYLMVVLSVDFFHFGLGSSSKDGNVEQVPNRYNNVMGIVKFTAIYGLPLALLTLDTNFIYLLIAIVVFRASIKYPGVKVDYYRAFIEKSHSDFGMDYLI